jgi:mRNA interferase YafQ
VKLAERRGKDLAKLRELILLLVEGDSLPARYKDRSQWELETSSRLPHRTRLAPALQVDGDDLHLVRTGTHSDLF